MLVAERYHQNLQGNLEKGTCSLQLHGNYSKNLHHSFSSKPIHPRKFTPIRKIDVAMNANSAFARSFYENFFNYLQFYFRELRIIRGEEQLFH